jgi:hypothetical protein
MSRATQKRRAKKAREAGASIDEPSAQRLRVEPEPPIPTLQPPAAPAAPSVGGGAGANPDGLGKYREWTLPMPPVGSELYEDLQIAIGEARTIRGRKYRYGALLLAGDDHIPLRAGNNKKPFQRENIHAEASVLKGCARPEGKDMLIARLAPTRESVGTGGGAGGREHVGYNSDDSDDDVAAAAAAVQGHAHASEASGGGKLLNARPCANCEAKMVRRGIRLCYFTLNATTLGVLEYNP